MSVAIVGGLDRLKRTYEREGKGMGFRIKYFGRRVPSLRKRLESVDAIVVFTSMISHPLMEEVRQIAGRLGIPLVRSRTSSVSGLRSCLSNCCG